MYKIVGFPRTRAMRAIWMLEELEEAYEIDPALPHSETVNKLNPSGRVPLLVDGDLVVSESIAMCAYLADKHGKLTFTAGSAQRAVQDSFTFFAADVLEGALWTAAKNTFIHPEGIRVPAIKEVCRYEFQKGLAVLEKRIGDGPFAMGDTFTFADIIIGHCGGWAVTAKFDLPRSGPLYDYFKRLRERPAYKAMMEKVTG